MNRVGQMGFYPRNFSNLLLFSSQACYSAPYWPACPPSLSRLTNHNSTAPGPQQFPTDPGPPLGLTLPRPQRGLTSPSPSMSRRRRKRCSSRSLTNTSTGSRTTTARPPLPSLSHKMRWEPSPGVTRWDATHDTVVMMMTLSYYQGESPWRPHPDCDLHRWPCVWLQGRGEIRGGADISSQAWGRLPRGAGQRIPEAGGAAPVQGAAGRGAGVQGVPRPPGATPRPRVHPQRRAAVSARICGQSTINSADRSINYRDRKLLWFYCSSHWLIVSLHSLLRCYGRDLISKGCKTDIMVAKFMHFLTALLHKLAVRQLLRMRTGCHLLIY